MPPWHWARNRALSAPEAPVRSTLRTQSLTLSVEAAVSRCLRPALWQATIISALVFCDAACRSMSRTQWAIASASFGADCADEAGDEFCAARVAGAAGGVSAEALSACRRAARCCASSCCCGVTGARSGSTSVFAPLLQGVSENCILPSAPEHLNTPAWAVNAKDKRANIKVRWSKGRILSGSALARAGPLGELSDDAPIIQRANVRSVYLWCWPDPADGSLSASLAADFSLGMCSAGSDGSLGGAMDGASGRMECL